MGILENNGAERVLAWRIFRCRVADVALGGHMEPPLSPLLLAHAPICFHDGVCFRLNRSAEAPTRILPAIRATDLIWFLNTCGAIPFADSAFGKATGYVFGLLAGSATAIIGSYLAQPTTFWLNRVFEALLTTGATMGQIVTALCKVAGPTDFDPYLLLGNPEMRLFSEERIRPAKADSFSYEVNVTSRRAIRLYAPSAAAIVPRHCRRWRSSLG